MSNDIEVDEGDVEERRPEDYCPDCGSDPLDRDLHVEGCRRIGQTTEIQCGPPWAPFPEEVST